MRHNITITTDAGRESVYVSVFKGILYREFMDLVVTEINTDIHLRNISQAAFYLQNSYSYFPNETLHIIDVDSSFVLHKRLLYTHYLTHHFLALDNGVLSLVLPGIETPMYEVKLDAILKESRYMKFAFAAQHILNNTRSDELFVPISRFKSFLQPLPSIIGNRLMAQILAKDKYGNCITNLHQDEFVRYQKGRKVLVHLPHGEKIEGIKESYYAVLEGEFVCIINSMGLLEIAINNGDAGSLLGMQIKSPIIFEFV